MRLEERNCGVHGPDRLNYKGGRREGGRQCILYADDTTARVTGELWPEIEQKLERALNPLLERERERFIPSHNNVKICSQNHSAL